MTVQEIVDAFLREGVTHADFLEFVTSIGIEDDGLVQEVLNDLLIREIIRGPPGTPPTFDQSDADDILAMLDSLEPRDAERGNPPQNAQTGGGHDGNERAGPSRAPYVMTKRRERTFASNAAVEVTYRVKLDEGQGGRNLRQMYDDLHAMFQDAIRRARGDLADNDLGRVVVHHDGLDNPIVVPLMRLDRLNANTVMEAIEKVLQSHRSLTVDTSLEIDLGFIRLPKGSGRRRITNIRGKKNNSLRLKSSVVTIDNDDHLCMSRAIGVAWAKLKRCSREEWSEIVARRDGKSNVELALEHRKVPLTFYDHLCKKNRKEQKTLAETICRRVGVSSDRPAGLGDLRAFEDFLDVRILVISARLGNKFLTCAETDRPERPCIYLYHVDDDHFHAITSVTGFFSSRYFCVRCLKHYDHKGSHQCEISCIVCKSDNCPKTDSPMSCLECHMTCRSPECFQRHRAPRVEKQGGVKIPRPSHCEQYWKCLTCHKVVNTEKRKPHEHVCGEYRCNTCETHVMSDHRCYLKAVQPKDFHDPKFVFFDFECSQDRIAECEGGYLPVKRPDCTHCSPDALCKQCVKCRNCASSWCGKASHRPNFVIAHTVCSKCIGKPLKPESVCKGCGTRCEDCDPTDFDKDPGPCPGICGFRETVFEGDDTLDKFGQWLFSEQHRKFKILAHNVKAYDGYPLLEYLIDQSIRPSKIIFNGSKIMYMKVEKALDITVIDSLNFLPMKLSALPKTFGLTELKKGWFPHYFNTKDNQDYRGAYPDPRFYGVDFMGNKERKDFFEWYDTVKDDVFEFRKEMTEYCRSDVDILRQSCLRFRDLLMKATGREVDGVDKKGRPVKKWVDQVDPFDYVTIASVCMGVFRTKFLEEEWRVRFTEDGPWMPAKLSKGVFSVWREDKWCEENIDYVPEKQFVRSPIAKIPPTGYREQYSKISIQWLEWMANRDGVRIQHALNVGEKKIPGTRYKLDGFCEETNTAYEFQGCVFHSCKVCFPNDRERTVHPLTGQSMKELYTLTKIKKRYLKSLGMKYVAIWEHEFLDLCSSDENVKRFVESLDLQDRLDPRESFFGGRTNASKLHYRVGESEKVRYVDFTSLYPWVNKYAKYPVGHPEIITSEFGDIDTYFGIAKVKILPPRGLYHPVLPYRSNGKLKFPLCRTCADAENQKPCTCNDEERALTGTWCTPELNEALSKGYSMRKIYEVYHWSDTTQYDPQTRKGGLFSEYIDTFLKFKQEASGPPAWVRSNEDLVEYVRQYFEKEGVTLDMEAIMKNPGLRALAKLCLNSFWGKFGQRLNMRQTNFFHESEVNEFFQLMTDPMKEVQNFQIVADDIIHAEWTYNRKCQPSDDKTNIYLATFTTCWARLKLYGVLDKLDERVLYYDTDSVIYVSRPGEYDPPLGDYLGELTDELEEGDYIEEFVSGGPKNYAYRTEKGAETCKVRGFTLNFTNSKIINFDAIKDVVTAENPVTISVTNPSKICRDKRKRKLYNREEEKQYRMVYTKRVRLDNYDTRPYGY